MFLATSNGADATFLSVTPKALPPPIMTHESRLFLTSETVLLLERLDERDVLLLSILGGDASIVDFLPGAALGLALLETIVVST